MIADLTQRRQMLLTMQFGCLSTRCQHKTVYGNSPAKNKTALTIFTYKYKFILIFN